MDLLKIYYMSWMQEEVNHHFMHLNMSNDIGLTETNDPGMLKGLT